MLNGASARRRLGSTPVCGGFASRRSVRSDIARRRACDTRPPFADSQRSAGTTVEASDWCGALRALESPCKAISTRRPLTKQSGIAYLRRFSKQLISDARTTRVPLNRSSRFARNSPNRSARVEAGRLVFSFSIAYPGKGSGLPGRDSHAGAGALGRRQLSGSPTCGGPG